MYKRQVQSAYYLFSRSLLAASTIVLEALDGQDCVLERLRRPQIDKISVLEARGGVESTRIVSWRAPGGAGSSKKLFWRAPDRAGSTKTVSQTAPGGFESRKIVFRRDPGTPKMLQDALEGLKHYACSVFRSLARATTPSSVASDCYPGPHRSSLFYVI